MCRALRRLQLHLQSFEAKARGDRAGCGLASIYLATLAVVAVPTPFGSLVTLRLR